MRKLLPLLFAAVIGGVVAVSPLVYKRQHDMNWRNFHVVEEGVLYRSGQLPVAGLQRALANYGIRTVITLREVKDPPDPLDVQEEQLIKSKGLKFVRIPPRKWYPDAAGKVPAEASLQTFRAVMDDPTSYPVLVHCFAGIHRTGTMCAVYRMDYQGWTNDQAMAEMRTIGYSILDDHEDVLSFMTHYRPSRRPSRPANLPILQVSRQNDAHP